VAPITSRQHALVKQYRRVARGDERLALIDGWHLLEEALAAGIAIESVAVAAHAMTPASARLLARARRAGTAIAQVSASVLDGLSPVRTPSGIAALVRKRMATVRELLSATPPLLVVAVDMQDPGNVGAVIRSAEAGGATGVALTAGSADAWSWKALRAAMGSTFRMPVLAAESAAMVVNELRAAGVNVIASVPRGGTSLYATNLVSGLAFMIGGEGSGLAPALVESADQRVAIPMKPPVESLNAAVAAALLVYEARRQREVKS
jgi:TrmH family RNA methyltransferase